MSTTVNDVPSDALSVYELRLADRALVLSQRLQQWITHAPTLEEELALSNIALDLLGQARTLYATIAERAGRGIGEDDLAYGRSVREFVHPLLVEQPNGDFASTMVRQLLHDAWAVELWRALSSSSDPGLAALAQRAQKETAYHLRHSSTWVVRLGDGTEVSRTRTQDALDHLWRFTGELFEVDAVDEELIAAGVVPDAHELQPAWSTRIDAVLADATLRRPDGVVMRTGGRAGLHSEAFGRLLDELRAVRCTVPGVSW